MRPSRVFLLEVLLLVVGYGESDPVAGGRIKLLITDPKK